MARYWGRYVFLLLTVLVLVACGGVSPEAESTLVEVPSTTPIPPTSSLEPSPTSLPTETATLTPAPQPSPTAASEPTPPPTEAIPTPAPEFGTRRQNSESNQIEYWDGAEWRLPERFEPKSGTFIDVFPGTETVIITPEDEIIVALQGYNAFSIPELVDLNESATTSIESESIVINTHDQGAYTDATLFFINTFLPVAATLEDWMIIFNGKTVEVPAIRLTVAYKHADGRVLDGELVFAYMVQDRYGNITDNFNTLLLQFKNEPKRFGTFIVTSSIEERQKLLPDFWAHFFPFDESDVGTVLQAIDSGGFVFGDPIAGNAISPTVVDLEN